jgi:hypothetical protein
MRCGRGFSATSRRQSCRLPRSKLRMEAVPTRAGLAALAQMRRQELDGFIEGLFGHEKMIDLPKRVHRGLDDLGHMRALFEAVVALAMDDAQPVTDKGMETTLRRTHPGSALLDVERGAPGSAVAYSAAMGTLGTHPGSALLDVERGAPGSAVAYSAAMGTLASGRAFHAHGVSSLTRFAG